MRTNPLQGGADDVRGFSSIPTTRAMTRITQEDSDSTANDKDTLLYMSKVS